MSKNKIEKNDVENETIKREILELFYLNSYLVALSTTQNNETISAIPTKLVLEIETKMKMLCPDLLENCKKTHHNMIGESLNKEKFSGVKSFFRKTFGK